MPQEGLPHIAINPQALELRCKCMLEVMEVNGHEPWLVYK